MMRRKGVPCSCENDSLKCGNKVRKIDGISPDPNGDFTIEAGNGIAINTGENKITIINDAMASSFVAGDNIEINPSGDNLEIRLKDNVVIGGDLTVNGTYYTVHAEHVYTEDDYIIMRDGASTGLGAGDYSGFQVKKYDGTNDGRLVIDKDGVARVGDVGDEQPLLTRSESGSLTNDHILKWDSVNQKAIDSGIGASDVVVKTSTNQDIYGIKTFKDSLWMEGSTNTKKDISVTTPLSDQIRPIYTFYNDNYVRVGNLYLLKSSVTGKLSLNLELLNSDGNTYTYLTLGTST